MNTGHADAAKQRQTVARQQAAAAARLRRRAAEDRTFAAFMRMLHQRLLLWRLCTKKRCMRARRCCGDAIRCCARRWPAARSCLREATKARRRGRSQDAAVARHLREWSDDGEVLTRTTTEIVTFRWLTPDEAKAQGLWPGHPRSGS